MAAYCVAISLAYANQLPITVRSLTQAVLQQVPVNFTFTLYVQKQTSVYLK